MTTSPSTPQAEAATLTAGPAATAATIPEPAAVAGKKSGARPDRRQAVQPVLEQLFTFYPHLFGAEFLPLKRGIFQELLEAHPDVFQRDSLKAALAFHARSTRYLQCVAAGKARHDLSGAVVEQVAPEHVFQAIVELHRRRQARTQEDLQPGLRARMAAAFEATGLSRADYLALVQPADEKLAALLQEALDESASRTARQEALVKAFEASGKSVREFADMYGLHERDVSAALARQRRAQTVSAAS